MSLNSTLLACRLGLSKDADLPKLVPKFMQTLMPLPQRSRKEADFDDERRSLGQEQQRPVLQCTEPDASSAKSSGPQTAALLEPDQRDRD